MNSVRIGAFDYEWNYCFEWMWCQVAIVALLQYARELGSLHGVYGYDMLEGYKL